MDEGMDISVEVKNRFELQEIIDLAMEKLTETQKLSLIHI